MTYTGTRLTLITTTASKAPMGWKMEGTSTRLASLGSIAALRIALEFAVGELGLDVERVVVDRIGGQDDFLSLLLHIPKAFTGDALFVRDGGSGFLSVAGAGRMRALLSLEPDQVWSYLVRNDLVLDNDDRLIA